jgi:hypothetical protein
VEVVDIVGEGIVLHVASILPLIVADDGIVIMVYQFGTVSGFPVVHIELAACVNNLLGDAETDICSELILSGVLLDYIADVDWDYVRIETPLG